MDFPPPYDSLERLLPQLRARGYAALEPDAVAAWSGCEPAQLQALCPAWDDLPPDTFLKDGGRYRRRRHACYVAEGGTLTRAPHRAHWQPLEYNALHGGMRRWFEPVQEATAAQPAWARLLLTLAGAADALRGTQPWFIEAHPFRIDTTDGIGRPTPEGAHRDGVDLVAVFLLARAGVKGGETRVFDAGGPTGQRFTLAEPWSLLLMDDTRVIHETTPIQPTAPGGHRDTLVLTCRADGFQGG